MVGHKRARRQYLQAARFGILSWAWPCPCFNPWSQLTLSRQLALPWASLS